MNQSNWLSAGIGLMISTVAIWTICATVSLLYGPVLGIGDPRWLQWVSSQAVNTTIGMTILVLAYWLFAAVFGKGNVLHSRLANISLIFAVFLFLLIVANDVQPFLPAPLVDCIDISSDVGLLHQNCKVDTLWSQLLNYGSMATLFISLAIRIFHSRKTANV